ncbi:MAG TPA: DUF3488 and transglutaminase-like domain-containing protein [Gammaproteobacteria bacterium]
MKAAAPGRTSVVAQLDARPSTGTVRILLFALALLFAGLASYIQPWISLFAFVMLAWRAWAANRGARMPGRWVKTALAITGFAMVLGSYRTLNGAEAGGALLLVMIALKLTEVQRLRDAVFVIVLAYFLMFAGFLYNQEIPFVAWMLLSGWALTGAMLVVTRNPEQPSFGDALRQSGRYLLQALPFAIIIFVLFPRIPGPLWGVPSPGSSAVSGLDDSMTPGSISRLVMSDEIAFRVRFEGDLPQPDERYWRGPTLHLFNGRTWIQGFVPIVDTERAANTSKPSRYSVMIEPHRRTWLYALTVPVEYPDDAVLTRDYQLATRQTVNQRRAYDIVSHLDYVLGPVLTDVERRWALQMPPRYNPRSRELASRWRAESRSDAEIVERALRMFREEPFFYTLEPPPLRGNTVDDFLFETRAGFCEHYASAFTFLMRAAGVPARVVTGYLGGEMNVFSGLFEVRQSDAHAWAEVWLPESGWTRIDPTGAVAPNRIERGISEALSGGEVPAHLARGASNLMAMLELQWGAINAVWYEFFLGFGPDMQRNLLQWLGLDDPDWRNMMLAMIVLLAAGGGVLWAWLLWTHRVQPGDPALRLYRKLQQRLARRLGPPRPHEGPRDFAARVARDAPAFAPRVRVFVDEYVRLRYLPHRRSGGLRRLRAALRKIREK